jgi:hypothetical protein
MPCLLFLYDILSLPGSASPMCTVGSGTVVHPTAVIKAEAGPIVIGGLNIIEEHTQILHLSNATSNHTDVITGSTMTIGSHNMFEVGSRTCSGYCLVVWLSCCDVLATTPSHLSVSLSLFFFAIAHFSAGVGGGV